MGQDVVGIRDRATFQALRRPVGRVARGPIRVAYVPLPAATPPGGPPLARVGYAVDRRCGNAVHRNRLRRRLREAVRLAVREGAGTVQAGSYLLRPDPVAATLPYPALAELVRTAMAAAGDRPPATARHRPPGVTRPPAGRGRLS